MAGDPAALLAECLRRRLKTKAVDALRQVLDGRPVSVGRARGGGQSSKAKGRRGVEAVQRLMLDAFGHLTADDIFIKATSQTGCDLHFSPAAQLCLPLAPEVKNVESLNIWAALKQAEANAGEKAPVVFFSRAGAPWYVALPAARFLSFLRQVHDGKEAAGGNQQSGA